MAAPKVIGSIWEPSTSGCYVHILDMDYILLYLNCQKPKRKHTYNIINNLRCIRIGTEIDFQRRE